MNLNHFYLRAPNELIHGTARSRATTKLWHRHPAWYVFSVSDALIGALSASAGFFKRKKHTPQHKNPALALRALIRPSTAVSGLNPLNTYPACALLDRESFPDGTEKGFFVQRANPTSGFRPLILFFWMVLVLCTVGCRKVETRFNVLSFRDPDHRDLFTQPFEPGSFFINAQRNYEIVFRIPPTLIGGDVLSEDTPHTKMVGSPDEADSETDTPPQDAIWMSQIIHVKVFWRPLPGTTYAESSQTNASILYCLITGSDAISYEGAGFVYFRPSRDGRTLRGKIESSSLFPTRFSGDADDIFGSCRLTGSFTAEDDNTGVASALHEIRRRLGPPVSSDRETPAY